MSPLSFAAGVLAGSFGVALAIVGRREYVRKRQRWSESVRPTPPPTVFAVPTNGTPAGKATIYSGTRHPRKRPV